MPQQYKIALLDGAEMKTKRSALSYLADQLTLKIVPRDLEELEDSLGKINRPLKIILLDHEIFLQSLEEYGDELLELLMDAAQTNPALTLYLAQPVFESEKANASDI